MKTTPLLMRPELVAATIDGRKTMTRRIAKNIEELPNGMITPKAGYTPRRTSDQVSYCPYGKPGDLIWIKEPWRIGAWDENTGQICIDYKDGPRKEWVQVPDGDVFERLWIQCSDELAAKGVQYDSDGQYRWEPGESPLRWRSPLHMFQWASRLTLVIEDVRLERLQDISEEDARAEGAPFELGKLESMILGAKAMYRSGFVRLWQSINGPGSWEANPFVWVISYRAILQNADKYLEL
jgi:hypothetical protein